MKVFFDTEFTGLHKNTSLISIGCVSEKKDVFYAELVDFNKNEVDDWLKSNVFSQTIRVDSEGKLTKSDAKREGEISNYTDKSLFCVGNCMTVRNELMQWFDSIREENPIEFVSDVCHYDMVLLIDLLTNGGSALQLPEWISACCHDINQDIAKFLKITEKEAFGVDRERFLTQFNMYYCTIAKHDSLHDALVICDIYKSIKDARRH